MPGQVICIRHPEQLCLLHRVACDFLKVSSSMNLCMFYITEPSVAETVYHELQGGLCVVNYRYGNVSAPQAEFRIMFPWSDGGKPRRA